jgi:hypothetical protein
MKELFFPRVSHIIIAVLLICASSGCERTHSKVHLIVPRQFRGAIIIYVNQDDGLSIARKDGVFTYVIPKSGTIRIKDNPFKNYSITVSYDDGKVMPVKSADDMPRTEHSFTG